MLVFKRLQCRVTTTSTVLVCGKTSTLSFGADTAQMISLISRVIPAGFLVNFLKYWWGNEKQEWAKSSLSQPLLTLIPSKTRFFLPHAANDWAPTQKLKHNNLPWNIRQLNIRTVQRFTFRHWNESCSHVQLLSLNCYLHVAQSPEKTNILQILRGHPTEATVLQIGH